MGSTGEKVDTSEYFDFQAAILAFGAGVIGVFSFLFGSGNILLGDPLNGILLMVLAIIAFWALFALRKRF